MDSYMLSKTYRGHEDYVRDIAFSKVYEHLIYSCSQDRTVRLWSAADDCRLIFDNQSWVICILEKKEGGLFSGARDGTIHIYDYSFNPVSVINAHDGGVVSLSYCGDNLVSGGWDGCAKVWKLPEMSLLYTLSDHENAVSVLGLNETTIITATTGIQQGESGSPDAKIVGCKIRIFVNQQLIKTIDKHTGPIRCLKLVSNNRFLSTSNDGTICVWDCNGNLQQQFTCPENEEGKPPFIMQACEISDNIYGSVSDDCICRIWKDSICSQEIQHPSSLWCICSTPTGDIITGCSDHVIRIFTQDSSKIASDEEMNTFYEEIKTAQESKTGENIDISTLPIYNGINTEPGSKNNEVKVFNRNGEAIAFQWETDSNTWIEIGKVLNNTKTPASDGKLYDKVQAVELEGGHGPTTFELAFNYEDNPYTVADEFLMKNNIPIFYRPQIIDFIQKSKQSGNVVIGGGNESNQQQTQQFVSQYFPQTDFNSFIKTNLTGLEKRIIELFASKPEHIAELKQIIDILKDESHYHISEISDKVIPIINDSIELFTPSNLFVSCDFMRHISVHPSGKELLINKGEGVIFALYNKILEKSNEVPSITIGLFYKLICNLFKNRPPHDLLLNFKSLFFQHMMYYLERNEQHKCFITTAGLLMNYAILNNIDNNLNNNLDDMDKLLQGCFYIYEHDEDPNIKNLCLRVIGTAVYKNGNSQLKANIVSRISNYQPDQLNPSLLPDLIKFCQL